MRKLLFAAAALLVTTQVFAQTIPSGPKGDTPAPSRPSVSPGAPIDLGPTSGSDRAFRGGGTILEGAPGAPAPTPRALLPDRKPN
ncbi:hypothetical protein [Plastoroseomonas arctica]|uniref:Uncharacterized protein n=1 Tax=Plastoroseomonas arctica TaxID=1509237 RepID=A0AAF1JW69_9PROT|nr:hypothetical protein [Plastoroseomonas arctica]MBR0655156.1 hypothetical protein [Plastoroseomonas arctica]